eukprot:scaffold7977_cov77-Cyclotella_meneghiniana.AAC.4
MRGLPEILMQMIKMPHLKEKELMIYRLTPVQMIGLHKQSGARHTKHHRVLRFVHQDWQVL